MIHQRINSAFAYAAVFIASCSSDSVNLSKVFKYDGSVQCEGAGIAVQVMERDLTNAGIGVSCGQKAGDGYAYPALCGVATGMINVYTIDTRDLSTAEDVGFESTATLPNYEDQACRPRT